MTPFFKFLPAALLVAGCAASTPDERYAPVTGELYSEFSQQTVAESEYTPFVAGALAQQNAAFADSASHYLRALEADPDNQLIANRAFFQLLYAGRMEEAAQIAVSISETGQDDSNDDLVSILYVLEGFKRQDWQAVRDRLNTVEMTGFGGMMTPLLRSWTHTAEQNFDAAKKALAPMVIDQRLKPIADEHMAYMLDHLDRFDRAEEQYLRLANATQPSSLQPFVAYAHMLARSGRREDARSFLGEQAARFSNNRFLLREGRLIAAGQPPTQATAHPRGAVGGMFYRLASEFSRSNSPQAAVVYLRIASYLIPEVADIYFMLGNLMDEMDNAAAAATAYNSVPFTSPLRLVAEERRINALRRAGRSAEAEDALRAALRDNPQQPIYLVALGDVLRERSDFGEAILHYSEAIKINRNLGRPDWFAFFARGVSYEQSDDWPRAEADFLAALEISPDEPSVLNYLGYSWIDRGQRVAEAKALIERAVEQRPEDGFIVDSLGWVNYLTGDYEEAVRLLEKAVRMEPDDVTINHHLGDAYWRVGRFIEARFQWQHAIDSSPDPDELAQLIHKMDMGLPEDS